MHDSRLVDQVRDAVAERGLSPRTAEAYVGWTRRFLSHYAPRRPLELGAAEVEAFVAHLGAQGGVAASTQNQALAAILFLYSRVLGSPLAESGALTRAKLPKREPVVLTRAEVAAVLARMSGATQLMAALLYGAGLRLLECARLRVRDVDLERRELLVRDGRAELGRTTLLPAELVPPLREHLARVRALHESDVAAGAGWADVPPTLAASDLARAWSLQWVFPATRLHLDSATGRRRRRHMHQTVLQNAVRDAVLATGLAKRASCHTLRHSRRTGSRRATTSAPSRTSSVTRRSARRWSTRTPCTDSPHGAGRCACPPRAVSRGPIRPELACPARRAHASMGRRGGPTRSIMGPGLSWTCGGFGRTLSGGVIAHPPVDRP